MYDYYEFFAGGGMARAGLGSNWNCLFANDHDLKKARTYENNWGSGTLVTSDVAKLRSEDIPGIAQLVWASFPCQDLSLAGGGAGLRGDRSGTFWPFWRVVQDLIAEGRSPDIIVLENVIGTLTSHDGDDFTTICHTLGESGYRCSAMVIDAALFVPQSRPRLFFLAYRKDISLPSHLHSENPTPPWHTKPLKRAFSKLGQKEKDNWLWLDLPMPTVATKRLSQLIEPNPDSVDWHTQKETQLILNHMTELNRKKVEMAARDGMRIVGTVYKRTRKDADGNKVVRAEVRFDQVAGCLRTPSGGSSRQTIMIVEGSIIKSRLISSRETARLMGLPDTYQLPLNYNEAYHLTGDGVVVPVVQHLAACLLKPILDENARVSQVAA